MDAALAAGVPLEVLDGIRDVRRRAVDARLDERVVEDSPRRADERLAGPVLLVARLLADQHHLRSRRALAEHGLGPNFPEVAAATARSRVAEGGQ